PPQIGLLYAGPSLNDSSGNSPLQQLEESLKSRNRFQKLQLYNAGAPSLLMAHHQQRMAACLKSLPKDSVQLVIYLFSPQRSGFASYALKEQGAGWAGSSVAQSLPGIFLANTRLLLSAWRLAATREMEEKA